MSKIEEMNARKEFALSQRKSITSKLVSGDITFQDAVALSGEDDYKYIRKIKLAALLGSFPGWTEDAARHALVSFSLDTDLKISDCRSSPRNTRIISMLMSSSARKWHTREKAPDGWPWFGNILSALKELEGVELPREVALATRYEFGDKKPLKDNSEESNLDEILGIDDDLDSPDSDDDNDDILDRLGL